MLDNATIGGTESKLGSTLNALFAQVYFTINSRPLRYRSKVTARLVIIGLMACFILIVFVNKFVFIAQMVPISFHIHM